MAIDKILGLDVSHWNTATNVMEEWIEQSSFAICKATEGATYKDQKTMAWIRYFMGFDNIGPIGLYHFCRPDVCDTEQEFANFSSVIDMIISKYPAEYFFLVLDWEGKALDQDPYKCEELVRMIHERYGAYPFIYTNKTGLKRFKSFDYIINNCGLWLANYKEGPSDPSPWAMLAMRQTTSTPFDKDEFYGRVDQLAKYCIPVKNKEPEEAEQYCRCCVNRGTCNGCCIHES